MGKPRKPRDPLTRLAEAEEAIRRLFRRKPDVEVKTSGTPTLTREGQIVATPTAIYWRVDGTTHHANAD
jgi:hypothetical protein